MSTFGTEPHKLVRTNDPDTSHAAARAVDTTALEARVYSYIASKGAAGCISDEVRDAFPHLPYSSVTARYKALIDKHLIGVNGKRSGHSGRQQRVMHAL